MTVDDKLKHALRDLILEHILKGNIAQLPANVHIHVHGPVIIGDDRAAAYAITRTRMSKSAGG